MNTLNINCTEIEINRVTSISSTRVRDSRLKILRACLETRRRGTRGTLQFEREIISSTKDRYRSLSTEVSLAGNFQGPRVEATRFHAILTGKVAARSVHVARTTPVDWASRRATAPGLSPSCSRRLSLSRSACRSLSPIPSFSHRHTQLVADVHLWARL